MEDKDIKSMSFEAAMAELETLVTKLDQGDVSLENSIALYERGAQLRAHCETRLKEAELKINKITQAQDGKVMLAEADELSR